MAVRIETLISSQRQLLQHISHELRTPLTRLGLSADLARRTAGPLATPAIDRIEDEAERLNALIDRILRFSRLQSAHDPLAREPIDLTDFLEGIVADCDFEARSQDKQTTLIRSDGGRTHGDRDLLRGAIENVIRNGLRYTPPGASVDVEHRFDPMRGHVIQVGDHGPGVPADRLESIFEPFVRLMAKGEAEQSGFGLGLAIAKRSIELHNGSIWAQNSNDGGLAVTLQLPPSEKS